MKKKYYILAITFLCMLVGQNSYGQWSGGDYDDPSESCAAYPEICKVLSDLFSVEVLKFDMRDDGEVRDISYANQDGVFIQVFEQVSADIDTSDYNSSNDNCEYFPLLCEVLNSYYDEDNNVLDNPCTITCPTGYILISSTCECKQLPPCFETSTITNPSQTSPIVQQISEILNGLGISGDTKSAIIALAGEGADLSAFANYLDAIKYLGRAVGVAGAAISLNNYADYPTTQNLLQFVFDSSAAVLAFSSGPAAPFVSFAATLSNATGVTSYVLADLANLIDSSAGCNVGQGIYNKFIEN